MTFTFLTPPLGALKFFLFLFLKKSMVILFHKNIKVRQNNIMLFLPYFEVLFKNKQLGGSQTLGCHRRHYNVII